MREAAAHRDLRLTERAHRIARAVLRPGDWAVDATAGNGRDTLFLARAVGPAGRVFGCDRQPAAIAATRARLGPDACRARVELMEGDHRHLALALPPEARGRIRVLMMNLGYLPHGDRQITTRAASTLSALESILPLLAPGGRATVVAYTGHPGGREEARSVRAWAAALPAQRYRPFLPAPPPRGRSRPELCWVEVRRPAGHSSGIDQSRDPMRKTLEQVEQLLRRYGHTYHANLAMVTREAWVRDPREGLRELNSSEWWGEADSVAAVDLAIEGGFSSRARRDGASLRAALIELARLLKERGVDNPEAELVAAQMRKWLVSGI